MGSRGRFGKEQRCSDWSLCYPITYNHIRLSVSLWEVHHSVPNPSTVHLTRSVSGSHTNPSPTFLRICRYLQINSLLGCCSISMLNFVCFYHRDMHSSSRIAHCYLLCSNHSCRTTSKTIFRFSWQWEMKSGGTWHPHEELQEPLAKQGIEPLALYL